MNVKMSLAEFYAIVDEWDSKLEDRLLSSNSWNYADGKMHCTVNVDGLFKAYLRHDATPNENAWAQLGDKFDFPVKWFYRQDEALKEKIINYKLAHSDKAAYLWRMRHDDNGEEILRAVLSDKYQPYNHKQLWTALMEAIVNSGLESLKPVIFRPYVSDVMSGYILFENAEAKNLPDPKTKDGGGNGGIKPAIFFANGEDGNRKLVITGGFYRGVCSNGLIYGWNAEESLNLIHRKVGNDYFDFAVRSGILNAMASCKLAIEQYAKALTERIDQEALPRMIESWFETFSVEPEIVSWAEDLKAINRNCADLTYADVIDSLTYRASQIDAETTRITMERFAGQLLSSIK